MERIPFQLTECRCLFAAEVLAFALTGLVYWIVN